QSARRLSVLADAAARRQQGADDRADQGCGGADHEPGQPGQQIAAATKESAMNSNRRDVIRALTASGAVLATAGAARANPGVGDLAALKKDTDVACVYHCDFGEPQRFSQMLQSIL